MSRRNKNNDILTVDAFSNPMFRLGFGTQAPLEATEYPLTRLTDNYAKLNSMYRSVGILQSIIDVVPQDMLREWFTLSGDIDPDKQAEFDKAVQKIKLKSKIDEGLRWGRLYGGAAGFIMIKGQEDSLDKPLDLEAILPDSFHGLWILDRWSGVFPGQELVMDPSDPDFGLPKYYEVRASETGQIISRVHHSRVIRFTGRELPYLEKLAEMYWGESEVEPIYDDIALYDSIMSNMGNLTFQANVDTLAIKNLEQLFSVGTREQQIRFWNMMQAQSVAKSNFGTRLIDQDTQLQTSQYSFAGFDYVVDAAQTNLSAKTHIPVTKLFGRSPAGMNATGDSDMQNYYDIIDGLRESKLRPILERLLPVLCMSIWGEVPEDIDITFPPLWTPTAAELAQIASAKSQAIIGAWQAGLLNLGPAQNELKKLADETGMFDSIEDELIKKNKDTTYQDTQQMNDPMAGLFGGEMSQMGEENEDADKSADEDEKTPQKPPQSPTKTSDGGPGSGNFGHAGRPGEVGGSSARGSRADKEWESHVAKIEPSKQLKTLASKVISFGKAAEPQVTDTMKKLSSATGGTMMGFSETNTDDDYRFKGVKSMARKLRDKSEQKGLTPEGYGPRVTDALRYTVQYDDAKFTSSYNKFTRLLQKEGYNIIEVSNTLHRTDVAYRGINLVIKTPKGYAFELQFHTPSSFHTKEHLNHKAYEVYREPNENPQRRRAAERYCVENANKITAPPGCEKIKAFKSTERVQNYE